MRQTQLYIDPDDLEGTVLELAHVLRGLDGPTRDLVRRIVPLFPERGLLVRAHYNLPWSIVDDPLADSFTFDTEARALLLFSSEPQTVINGLIEMAMYLRGFSVLDGRGGEWPTELAVGAWRRLRDNIKRSLGVSVAPMQQWALRPDRVSPDLPESLRRFPLMVAQLDHVSFTYLVRLAGRSNVAVSFTSVADPAARRLYRRARQLLRWVSDEFGLDDAAVFNHRLRQAVGMLADEFQPQDLPTPVWWRDSEARQTEQGDFNAEPPPAGQDTALEEAGLADFTGPAVDSGPPGDLELFERFLDNFFAGRDDLDRWFDDAAA